jgi:hypothetical protein
MKETISRHFSTKNIEIYGMDQFGLTSNLSKPYIIVKAKV